MAVSYGYASQSTGNPRRRASSISWSKRPAPPQLSTPESFRWAICTCTPVASATAMASRTASAPRLASSRTCDEYAAPCRRSTRASATISAESASQPGAVKSPDESPHAPAASASSSRRSIVASSSRVMGRLSIPAVMSLSVLWPTWKITLTEVAGNAATYSANVVWVSSSPGALGARYSRCIVIRSGSAGAAEKPQLPTTSSVTP